MITERLGRATRPAEPFGQGDMRLTGTVRPTSQA